MFVGLWPCTAEQFRGDGGKEQCRKNAGFFELTSKKASNLRGMRLDTSKKANKNAIEKDLTFKKAGNLRGARFDTSKKTSNARSNLFLALLWAALGCFGVLWATLVCFGLLWDALGCFGLLWTALVCFELL